MADTYDNTRRELIAKLQRPCGRGGYRISRDEARVLLQEMDARQLTAEERTQLRLAVDTARRLQVRRTPDTVLPGERRRMLKPPPSGRQVTYRDGQRAA